MKATENPRPRLVPPLLVTLAALGAAAGARAQILHLERVGGTLGKPLNITVSGDPGQLWILMPSFQRGPTPLRLFDPRDPRSLSIGMDMFLFFAIGTTSGGPSTVPVALPNVATLHGKTIHFQAFAVPGKNSIFGALSNPISSMMGTQLTWAPKQGILKAARVYPTVSPLIPGKLYLVAGGSASKPAMPPFGLATTELYRSDQQDFVSGPRMSVARVMHTANVIGVGRVLIAGGVDANGLVTKTCEIFDLRRGVFVPTGSLSVPRAGHRAVTLPDGRVLVIGGTSNVGTTLKALGAMLKTTEIYNPATGTWTAGPSLPSPIGGNGAVLLPSGKVLITGGLVLGPTNLPTNSTACYLFDPKTNTISTAASLPFATALHSATVLKTGQVLIAGGGALTPLITNSGAHGKAALYDPATNTWTTLSSMPQARAGHDAVLLADGRVLIAGGFQGTLFAPKAIAGTTFFDPATKTFTAGSPLPEARALNGTALLSTGQVLVFGGVGGTLGTPLKSGAFLFF